MKKRWSVQGVVTISVSAVVDADSYEEAINKTSRYSMPSICYSCSMQGDDPEDRVWKVEEIDGEARKLRAKKDS